MTQRNTQPAPKRTYCVYILRCADGTLYTGITNDLPRRIALHNAGRGAKYTRGRAPVTLLYCEPHADRADASRRERAVKRLSRAQKEALIAASPAPTPAPETNPS